MECPDDASENETDDAEGEEELSSMADELQSVQPKGEEGPPRKKSRQ